MLQILLKILKIISSKCGSSSLQNIFLRFGEKNNLTFAIPEKGHLLYGNDNFLA